MKLIILIILLLYVFMIIRYSIGWQKITRISQVGFTPNVSIVISLRNEEKNIYSLVKCLKSQIYPSNRLEIILVNDHSNDSTLELLNKIDLDNIRILNMPEGKYGKKDAISMAVSNATGEFILATDADCAFGNSWASIMVSYFKDPNIKLVSGPVNFKKENGFFQNFNTLEFLSLVSSGAGAIGVNNAIFCNGANMAYRKDIFLELSIFENDSSASGDDVFLLHSIKKKYPNSITFSKDKNSIVYTNSSLNFIDFISQRKRWAAKSISYKDIASIYTSYLVFLTNLSFVFLFIMSFYDISYLQFFMLFYLSKIIIDFSLIYPALNFFNRKDLIKSILYFEFFYSLYIIFIVVLSFTNKFEWKGRIYKK